MLVYFNINQSKSYIFYFAHCQDLPVNEGTKCIKVWNNLIRATLSHAMPTKFHKQTGSVRRKERDANVPKDLWWNVRK